MRWRKEVYRSGDEVEALSPATATTVGYSVGIEESLVGADGLRD